MRPKRSILALLAALALLLSVSATAASAAGSAAGVFRLTLTGDQEATPTCAPPELCGDPDAVGHMVLVVLPARDAVCFAVKWSGIDGTVTAAHIHLAPAGVPGGVVVPLFSGPLEGTDRVRACVPDNGLGEAILADPAAYYVNIHSNVFQPGAIRAQLG